MREPLAASRVTSYAQLLPDIEHDYIIAMLVPTFVNESLTKFQKSRDKERFTHRRLGGVPPSSTFRVSFLLTSVRKETGKRHIILF